MITIKKHKETYVIIGIVLLFSLIIILYFYVDYVREIINILIGSFILAYILRPIKIRIQGRCKIKDSTASLIIIIGIAMVYIPRLSISIPSISIGAVVMLLGIFGLARSIFH